MPSEPVERFDSLTRAGANRPTPAPPDPGTAAVERAEEALMDALAPVVDRTCGPAPELPDDTLVGPEAFEASMEYLAVQPSVQVATGAEEGHGDAAALNDHLVDADRRLDAELDRLNARRVLRRRPRAQAPRRPSCARRSPRRRRSPGRRSRGSSRGDPGGDGDDDPGGVDGSHGRRGTTGVAA